MSITLSPTKTKLPFGVYMIAGLMLLSGAATLLLAVGLLAGLPGLKLPGAAVLADADTSGLRIALASILAVDGLASLIAGIGLLLRKRWAWVAVMILVGLSLAASALLYYIDTPNYADMLINVIIVFYLNQRDVQTAFEAPAGSSRGQP